MEFPPPPLLFSHPTRGGERGGRGELKCFPAHHTTTRSSAGWLVGWLARSQSHATRRKRLKGLSPPAPIWAGLPPRHAILFLSHRIDTFPKVKIQLFSKSIFLKNAMNAGMQEFMVDDGNACVIIRQGREGGGGGGGGGGALLYPGCCRLYRETSASVAEWWSGGTAHWRQKEREGGSLLEERRADRPKEEGLSALSLLDAFSSPSSSHSVAALPQRDIYGNTTGGRRRSPSSHPPKKNS